MSKAWFVAVRKAISDEARLAHLAAEHRGLEPHQREAEHAAALPRAFEFFEHDGEHFVRQAVVERRS